MLTVVMLKFEHSGSFIGTVSESTANPQLHRPAGGELCRSIRWRSMAVSVTEPSTGSYPLSESSYSSADEEEFGLFQALPVAEVSVEDSGWEVLPQSVEEYLARVRYTIARASVSQLSS